MNDYMRCNSNQEKVSVKPTDKRPPVIGREFKNYVIEKTRENLNFDVKSGVMSKAMMPNREAEGNEANTPSFTESVTPPYIHWAHSLTSLLNDEEGVNLFTKFLMLEQCDNYLGFWFACKGFQKKQSQDVYKFSKLIYKKYINSSSPMCVNIIDANTRKAISHKLSTKVDVNLNIFDDALSEVQNFLEKSAFPNFLQSTTYLKYAHYVQNNGGSPGYPLCNSGFHSLCSSTQCLATLHEDKELQTVSASPLVMGTNQFKKLSKVPARCESRIPESQAGKYLNPDNVNQMKNINPYHIGYSSYVPVSARDSERQSMSSDARTDDSRSENTKHKISSKLKQMYANMQANANQNRDNDGLKPTIPKLNQTNNVQNSISSNPEKFLAELMHKLNVVKRTQDNEEQLLKSLMQSQEDDNQDILDKHCSRVFSNIDSPSPVDRLAGDGIASGKPVYPTLQKHSSTFASSKSLDSNHPQFLTNPIQVPSTEKMDRSVAFKMPVFGQNRLSLPSELSSMRESDIEKEQKMKLANALRMSMNCSENDNELRYKRSSTSSSSSRNRKHEEKMKMTESNMQMYSPFNKSTQGQFQPAHPHMYVQEDAIRRIDEHNRSKSSKTRNKDDNRHKISADLNANLNSSIRKGNSKSSGTPQNMNNAQVPEFTVVGYQYTNESIPYRTKLPGKNITLKDIKGAVKPNKNCKYFFKTIDIEFGNPCIKVELTDENEVCPLWEGKVYVTIEPID